MGALIREYIGEWPAMKISFEVGSRERHRLVFTRNWFTGRMTLSVDGEPATLQSPWDPSTHYNLTLVKNYEVKVGDPEVHSVRIEHTRPLILAGMRPHTYRVFADDQLLVKRHGY
jgi:hypothetical protein